MEGRNLYFKDFKSHGESSVRVLPRDYNIYIYIWRKHLVTINSPQEE